MPDPVRLNIINRAGISVIAKHHIGEDGASVIDICVEEKQSVAQIADDIEARMVEAIKTGNSGVREMFAKVYGSEVSSRSQIARCNLEMSGREASPSIKVRNCSGSIAPLATQAVATAPMISAKRPTLSSRTLCIAMKFAASSSSFIRRLLGEKQQPKPMTDEQVRADDSEVRNA